MAYSSTRHSPEPPMQRPLVPLAFTSLLLAASSLSAQPAAPTSSPAAATADFAARFDSLFPDREQVKVLEQLQTMAEERVKAKPDDFEARWRLARLYCWEANGFDDGEEPKAELGKQCWDEGEKAVALRPDDVHSQYWATVGMGLYSEGLGIISAIAKGIEGKYKNRVQRAIALDKSYVNGGPTMLFGRFWWKLPWPKRDNDEALRLLRETVAAHPKNLLAQLYLADALWSDGKKAEAKAAAQAVAEAAPGDDPPEDRRSISRARAWLAKH
jgi:hypothetical protein